MNSQPLIIQTLLLFVLFTGAFNQAFSATWITVEREQFSLRYTDDDAGNLADYEKMIVLGIQQAEAFFSEKFKEKFLVVIHPGRATLDSTWRSDWGMPEFKSECWMVASGIGKKLDMIAPGRWTQESCEHDGNDTVKTQKLITHELIHVFHGQHNISSDFSNVTGLDWFIEGLATYASGQCDSLRMAEVRKAIAENKIPPSLQQFRAGKLRYGLSGSVVMYLDQTYGRATMVALLPFNTIEGLMTHLKLTEGALLKDWREMIGK